MTDKAEAVARLQAEAATRAMAIKTSWLRTFLAVSERGGFGMAAAVLHLSQSRVSAHVAALEAALGASLFERNARPVTLTHAGEIFRAYAEHALEELQEGVAAVREADELRLHRIIVASYPSVSSVLLPSVLSILRQDRPDISVELAECTSAAALEAALTSGAADLAFRPLQPAFRSSGFTSLVLWREAIVAVMRADDPLAAQSMVTVSDLGNRPLIGNPAGPEDEGGGFDLRRAMGEAASSATIAYLSDQPATIAALVRAAFGVGVLSQLALVTVSLEGLAVRPIDSPTAYRDVGIHWSESRGDDEAIRAFVDAVRHTTAPHGVLAIDDAA